MPPTADRTRVTTFELAPATVSADGIASTTALPSRCQAGPVGASAVTIPGTPRLAVATAAGSPPRTKISIGVSTPVPTPWSVSACNPSYAGPAEASEDDWATPILIRENGTSRAPRISTATPAAIQRRPGVRRVARAHRPRGRHRRADADRDP